MNLGVIPDPRSEQDKAKDFTHEELMQLGAATEIFWQEKIPRDFRKFPSRNQFTSLSCGAHSGAKLFGIEDFRETMKFYDASALDIYDRRSGKPAGGMWGQQIFQILKDYGACREADLPSEGKNESEMNREVIRTGGMIDDGKDRAIGGYVEIKGRTIDVIGSVVAQGTPVILAIYFDYIGTEYWKPIPEILYPHMGVMDTTPVLTTRHFVVVVDYILYGGKKCLVIEDSAGNSSSIGGVGQRILTQDFLEKRCYYAAYALPKPNTAPTNPRPVHAFTGVLSYGTMNDGDVRALQDILKYEGFLNNTIISTGNYLEMTANALLKWQLAHQIASVSELNGLAGKRFGPASIKAANALYGA